MDLKSQGITAAVGPAKESPTPGRVAFWLATAALTGAVIMGLELVAFRLYAPYFGYSIYVWGSMISVVMAALSGGYALGGRMADRSQSDHPLYLVVLGAGVYQLAILLTVGKLLGALWRLGEFFGTGLATLIIFAPPMTALAITSPFVIRLLAGSGRVGVTAGKVYALSTVGSIAGILATAFYLIPNWGTQATLRVLCGTSSLVGAAGLAAKRQAALSSALVLLALGIAPEPRTSPYEIFKADSAYNLVRVIRYQGFQWLALNEARYSHTTRKVNSIWSGSYQDEFALGPLLVRSRRLLVLGMGAGGSITATRVTAPQIQVEAVEIDPKVVEAAGRFFGLRADPNWLSVRVADARPWLARDRSTYDLVHVDLYHGGPYVPFYLVTQEFFRLVRARLAEEGLLMMNVYDLGKKREILSATGATLKRVFPTVAILSRPDGNHILMAFSRARPIDSIQSQLKTANGGEGISELARKAAAAIVEFVPAPGARVFTDDDAPVEAMTARMLATQGH